MKGYCVKCQSKQEMAGAVEASLKNGRKAIKGKCPDCGTGMFKILGGKTAGKGKTPNRETTTTAPGASRFRFTFFD